MGDIPDIPRASPGHFLIASLHFLTEPAVTELKSKVEEANRSRRHPVYAFCGNIARQQAAEAACHAGNTLQQSLSRRAAVFTVGRATCTGCRTEIEDRL